MSPSNAFKVLKSSDKFWALKREIYRYITYVYLEGEIEESDWDTLTEIVLDQANLLTSFEEIVKDYEDRDGKVIFFNQHDLFPSARFIKNTNTKFNHF